MKVYRVENIDGLGPYRIDSDILQEWQVDILTEMSDDHLGSKHPTPVQDGIPHFTDDQVCGFESLDQLMEWFSGWEDKLDSCDFFISEYEVSSPRKVFVGKNQVTFCKDDAVMVKRNPAYMVVQCGECFEVYCEHPLESKYGTYPV